MDDVELIAAHLSRDLRRKLGREDLEHVLDLATSVREVLDDPNVMADLRRAFFSDHTDESSRATRSLKQSPKYQELRRDVGRVRTGRGPASSREVPSSSRRRSPPYAEQMAQALEEAEVEEFGESLPYPPPLVGGYVDGSIWVEAECWVPATVVDSYFRALQKGIGEPPRQVARASSLELYAWVKKRRRELKESETWLETTRAWNRSHPDRTYSSETNLHRDFHRVQRALAKSRPFFESLRKRALEIQLDEATRGS